jgi:hypothetical protein
MGHVFYEVSAFNVPFKLQNQSKRLELNYSLNVLVLGNCLVCYSKGGLLADYMDQLMYTKCPSTDYGCIHAIATVHFDPDEGAV